jgi:hypothetical protein
VGKKSIYFIVSMRFTSIPIPMATVFHQEPRIAENVAYRLNPVAHRSDQLRRRREPGDVVSRLGQFMHAAFLHAGLVPYGAALPPSGHLLNQSRESGSYICLSRRYTAPQLAGRKDADAAVLMLCAAKDRRSVVLVIFLTTDHDPKSGYRERLNATTVARFLDAEERPKRSRICASSLGNAVCWGFLDELCRRNGLPRPTGFMSLPDDAKVEILMRLRSGEDLARVECTCRDLRSVVGAHDGDLWRHMMSSREAPPRKEPMNYTDIAGYEKWRSRYDALLGRWIHHDEYEDLRSLASRCQWQPFVPVKFEEVRGVAQVEGGVP